MLFTGAYRKIAKPLVGLTLCTLTLINSSVPGMAQRLRQRSVPARQNVNRVQTQEGYILGVGDRIRIDNIDLPQQSGEYVIPTGGLLNLPLIGSVYVLGLTLEQTDRLITAQYNRILKEPEISIRLVEPRPINVAVSGEVNKPGSYTIPIIGRETGIRYPTLSQVIQQAEGITQSADLTRIQVRRRQISGASQVININLRLFLQTGAGGEDITLRDGDTIVVPTATNISLSQARQIATTSIATDINKPRTVTVLGEVTRPGAYVVLGGNTQIDRTTGGLPTLTRSLQLAGGITLQANIQNIQVRRPQKTGSEQIFNVNLWQFLQSGDSNQDLIVQDGDTIFIPTGPAFNEQQLRQLVNANFIADLTRPIGVTVVGEVSRPGSYVVIGDETRIDRTTAGFPTITRALQLAGGITQTADIRNIQVRRLKRIGSQEVLNVNLWQFLQAGDTSQNLILQDGDTIFIPTLAAYNPAEARQLATVNFAEDLTKPRTVAVVGEVQRPGPYVVLGGDTRIDRTTGGLPTVARAIQVAGGITAQADIRNIQIRRPTKTGIERIINVNFWQLLQAGDFSQDIILQEGDTVFVPTATDINTAEVSQLASASISPDTIQVSVVGEVGRPGQIQVGPNTTLNQAILSAGGFNRNRARRSAVELIRLNPNGTVSRRTVSVDFTQGINEETNPLLRNRDIIVVGRSGLARFADLFDTGLASGGFFSIFRIFEIFGNIF